MGMTLVTKTEFAKELGVGKSAVANWIKRGIITGDAIDGEGRRAKIKLEVGRQQVRDNRDIGQALGNGIATKTTVGPETASAPDADQGDIEVEPASETNTDAAQIDLPRLDSVDAQLKQARLEKMQRDNRREAEQDALERGQLMMARDAREQMARIAAEMLQVFEGAMPGFSEVLAERFDIPQRDALHLLREHFRQVRTDASKKQSKLTDQLEATVTKTVEG